MAMDVAYEVLTDPDFLVALRVNRFNPGSYVDGIFEEGDVLSFIVRASVQPTNSKDFTNLEEGERVGGLHTIYSRFEFKGSESLTGSDRIINYRGFNWKVVMSEQWGHHGYFKTLISKVDK